MDEPILDCLIVGGGPAGLTAAIYLARFHLDILVVDGGKSRAGWIPCTRNVSGFPDGIAGTELLQRMRDQACKYGAKIETEFVTQARARREERPVHRDLGLGQRDRAHRPARYRSHQSPAADGRGASRRCLGARPHPLLPDLRRLRGHRQEGRRDRQRQPWRRRGFVPAQLHRRRDPDRARQGDAAQARGLSEARRTRGSNASTVRPRPSPSASDCIIVDTAEGHYTFDTIYPALGSDTHIQLAEMAGADLSGDRCIKIDSHQRTSVPGLYAAGDVVIGLDQISHAMGEGGVAATTIRNDLAAKNPRWREPIQEMRASRKRQLITVLHL